MSTALATVSQMEAPTVTADQLDLVKRTVASGATDAELRLFLYDCARQGVHPLDRLLHFTKRGGKYTPVTSIDLMRTRAADTGEYAGSDDAAFHDTEPGDPNFHASVMVWRLVQGQRCAFTATARWSEYCPPSGQDMMWRKMPHTMLAKCAEALALRKGFPRQLAGLYAKEEMDQAGPSFGGEREPEREPEPIKEPQNSPVPQAQTPAPVKNAVLISEAQGKRYHAIARSAGWTDGEALTDWLFKTYTFASSKFITRDKYEAICEAVKKGPPATSAGPLHADELGF